MGGASGVHVRADPLLPESLGRGLGSDVSGSLEQGEAKRGLRMNERDTCEAMLQGILDEIEKLPSGPFWSRDIREGKYILPVSLPVGDGRSIAIRPEIRRKVSSFAVQLMERHFGSCRSRFSREDWQRMVSMSLGKAIARFADEAIEMDRRIVLGVVTDWLEDQIKDISEREYAFGCHLLGNSEIEPFSIGSVRFEPRLPWLARLGEYGVLSRIAQSRMRRTWNGEGLRKRQPSEDEFRETSALATVGDAECVCSVGVGAMGAEMGLRKALTGARLALTTIALAWRTPSWALGRFIVTFERIKHLQECVIVYPSGKLGWHSRWSALPPGVAWLEKEEWNRSRSELVSMFESAGEAIDFVTEVSADARRPRMMRALSQALLWFHEGCRENEDTMAIVKFCSAMEALACGGKKAGIRRLIISRFGAVDKRSLDESLDLIYGRGRNKTVHGDNDSVGHDWVDTRLAAEALTRELLLTCMEWMYERRDVDDPRLLQKSGG